MEWTTACPDWERRIVNRESLITCGALFAEEAEAALAVFKKLKIVDAPWVIDEDSGEARPQTAGEAFDEWVFDFVRAIFGAYDEKAKRRLIREFFLLIAKKNAKSTLAALIMLTALIRNWRVSALLLILAPTLEIANNSYQPAADAVRADAELSTLLHVKDHKREITHRVTNATLKVIAADSDVVGGSKASMVLVDEWWLFGKRANAGPMLREALGGLVARPEGFVIYLSTHSDEEPAGVFKEGLDKFRRIRDGDIVNPRCLGVMYEFPPAMLKARAYLKPENFYITNPNINRSVDDVWLREKLQEALDGEGEDSIQVFLAKHLNVEIGQRLAADAWAGAELWANGADDTLTLETLLARCEVCVAGADGGGADDLFGLCIAGRETGTDRWLFWHRAFALRSVLTRRKQIASQLKDFEKEGSLVFCDTLSAINKRVCEIVGQVIAAGKLAEKHGVGLDPAGIGALVDALDAIGVVEPQLTGINTQAWGMRGPIQTMEFKLHDGEMLHEGSALMRFCVANAKTTPVKNNVIIVKETAGKSKIDPLIAGLVCANLLARNPEAPAGYVTGSFIAA